MLSLAEAESRNPHLSSYLQAFRARNNSTPDFQLALEEEVSEIEFPNIMYPVGDPVFIHIYRGGETRKTSYFVIEPTLAKKEIYNNVLSSILREAPFEKATETKEEFEELIEKLLIRTTTTDIEQKSYFSGNKNKLILVTPEELKVIKYQIKREILDHGIIEPLLKDRNLEDIHTVGTKEIHVIHKLFGMLKTNIHFNNRRELNRYLRSLSERVGTPVSDNRPIVDSSLRDGSRLNIIFSDDISKEGASFTIRKFSEKPPPITQLVKWGTFSALQAAYLWLCLENHMSIFVSGETASGKTTSLNAMTSFINYNAKIFTAEDTPEVIVPQPVWQRLITREIGPQESRVELFDLIKAALRSRPDFIIVGEVRGKEGSAAFQGIQTGHAVLCTFHASSIEKMIQRFTGEPINVPIRFMDNLNVALFQELLYIKGRIMRRCSSIQEILRYSKAKDGVLTRQVFSWDPVTDRHYFTGRFNSHVLENKIAEKLGFGDVRDIYKDLDRRAKIITRMVNAGILDYDSVNKIFKSYSEEGFAGIPLEFSKE